MGKNDRRRLTDDFRISPYFELVAFIPCATPNVSQNSITVVVIAVVLLYSLLSFKSEIFRNIKKPYQFVLPQSLSSALE